MQILVITKSPACKVDTVRNIKAGGRIYCVFQTGVTERGNSRFIQEVLVQCSVILTRFLHCSSVFQEDASQEATM
jgi:hypothetical protein